MSTSTQYLDSMSGLAIYPTTLDSVSIVSLVVLLYKHNAPAEGSHQLEVNDPSDNQLID